MVAINLVRKQRLVKFVIQGQSRLSSVDNRNGVKWFVKTLIDLFCIETAVVMTSATALPTKSHTFPYRYATCPRPITFLALLRFHVLARHIGKALVPIEMQLRLVTDVVANETHFLLNFPAKTLQLVLINSFQLLATFATRDEIKRRLRETKHASERHVGLSNGISRR